jgi:hypothetical protein
VEQAAKCLKITTLTILPLDVMPQLLKGQILMSQQNHYVPRPETEGVCTEKPVKIGLPAKK